MLIEVSCDKFIDNWNFVVVKNCITRYRPIIYNDKVPIIKKLEKDASHSFFSRHTSLAATSTFFAASVISEYYPHSWQSRTAWIGASILPAICGILRIESGQHFPTDVITGLQAVAMRIVIRDVLKQNLFQWQ